MKITKHSYSIKFRVIDLREEHFFRPRLNLTKASSEIPELFALNINLVITFNSAKAIPKTFMILSNGKQRLSIKDRIRCDVPIKIYIESLQF